MSPRFLLDQYPEIAELLSDRSLSFPIPTKQAFVDQVTRSGTPVVFRKTSYDPHFAVGLMPEFFFPVTSPEDLLQRGAELMIARGLFKLPQEATGNA